MNKDMMNIDDFVRDKLGGHTEKEDPAAWLRMKALLDKEMPEKAAPFVFGWRKPAAFLGAALLIGALCAGGYQLNAIREKSGNAIATTHHTPEPSTKDKHTNTTATNTPDHNPDLLTAPDSPSPQSPDTKGSLSENNAASRGTAATTNPVAANRSSGDASASLTETNNTHMPGQRTANPAQQQRSAAHTTTRSGSTAVRGTEHAASSVKPGSSNHTATAMQHEEATGTGSKTNAAKATASAAANRYTDAATNGTTGTSSNSNTAQQGIGQLTKKEKAGGKAASRVLNSASGSTATHKEIAPKHKKDKDGLTAKASHAPDEKGQELARNKEAVNPREATVSHNDEPKDSISAITVVTRESTSRGGYPKKITRITDTIAITKVPVIPVNNTIVSSVQPSKKEVKMAAAESKKANKLASQKQAPQQKNVYASAAKPEVKENAGKAAAPAQVESVVKVKKEKSAFTQWWENLPEAMADAKRDFKSAKFFWGLSGGVNYSSPNGSGGFQGVQFGPTGELVFNKHWSLFGAIKYFNRSGSKKMVSDNFSSQIAEQDSVRGANWYFTARTDSTNRYFNFSTVHSFEMPITLRYTIRKFYLMTGINLAYYLPVNVEKVEREYNNMNVHVIMTNSSKVILSDPTKPQLNISDFGSRFGMGYVIGAGYQITPAWQVDMRIVNPFWDNAKGAGAQKLSKDFYKLPSVQLSFGYQINRIRNRATFGPNSAP